MSSLLFYYIISLVIFYLIGRSFFIIFKFDKNKVFDVRIENFYLVIGLIVASQILFLFNFFSGLSEFNLILSLIPFLIINSIRFSFPKFSSKSFLKILIIFIFFISFFDIGLSKDSYLYHLSSQNWLYSEKIVFGISNLNPYLGYMSISEYSSAVLNEINLNLAHVFNLIFLITFFTTIIEFISSENFFYRNIAFSLGIFGVLDNFGFDGGRNGFIAIQEINKFDYSFSIISFLFVIFSLNHLLYKNRISNIELLTLSLFLIFAIQMRIIGVVLFILFLTILIKFKQFKSYSHFSFLLLLAWMIKNIINTSCIFYPIPQTCIKSNWLFINQAEYINRIVLDSFRDPENGINSLDNFYWIIEVFIPSNKNIIFNFFISVALLRVLFTIYSKIANTKKNKFKIIYFLSSLSFILFWIFFLPQYRFSSFFLMVALIIFNFDLMKTDFKINHFVNLSLTIVSLILVINLNDYKSFINDPFSELKIELPIVEYIEMPFYGVVPKSENSKGILCFQRTDCYSGKYNLILEEQNGYKFIKPIDTDYYSKLIN